MLKSLNENTKRMTMNEKMKILFTTHFCQSVDGYSQVSRVRCSYLFVSRSYSTTKDSFLDKFFTYRFYLPAFLDFRILFYAIFHLILWFGITKIILWSGYLFMDELQRALSQFYPASGGGGFSQLPTPTPPPENYGLGLIPGAQGEGDQPGSNHYASGSSQEAHPEGQPGSSHLAPQGVEGQKRLLSVLERHLRRHCASPARIHKYPYVVDWKQEDFHYFAQHIAISELDSDTKTDIEMGNLADYLKNYKKLKTLLDQYLKKRFEDEGGG